MRSAFLTGVAGLFAAVLKVSAVNATVAACEVGSWTAPGALRPIDHSAVIGVAATAPIVLLGDTREQPDHHRWHLTFVAGLGQRENLVLGFDAFAVARAACPRSLGPGRPQCGGVP